VPAQYTAIRDSLISRGEDTKDAKRIAAMTYIKRGKGGTRSGRAKTLAADRKTGR
jgi:hypothetical protein